MLYIYIYIHIANTHTYTRFILQGDIYHLNNLLKLGFFPWSPNIKMLICLIFLPWPFSDNSEISFPKNLITVKKDIAFLYQTCICLPSGRIAKIVLQRVSSGSHHSPKSLSDKTSDLKILIPFIYPQLVFWNQTQLYNQILKSIILFPFLKSSTHIIFVKCIFSNNQDQQWGIRVYFPLIFTPCFHSAFKEIFTWQCLALTSFILCDWVWRAYSSLAKYLWSPDFHASKGKEAISHTFTGVWKQWNLASYLSSRVVRTNVKSSSTSDVGG